MNKQKVILTIIILFLLGSNVFLASKYLETQKELRETRAIIQTQKTSDKILDFTKLFIAKVLKSEGEIDFETRLKLENSVRDLDDEEILSQWNKFTASKTEVEAQKEVKNLLEMLVDKIEAR